MRRSSRQQPPPPTGSTSTSGPSSTASQRLERSTRSNNKQSSPQKSATPQSALSSDNNDTEDGGAPLARRSKRGQQESSKAEDEDVPKLEDDEGEEEGGDEEEVTRCLCGLADYPGPPEVRSKSNHPAVDLQGEDAGGMFIQCDVCKVWQHGGCVGIMDEAQSPDDYFCEQCRPEYHEVSTAKNGQKYSLYLPVHEKLTSKGSHRKSSTSREVDARTAKEKEKALRADALAKRRSTMNSRSAYDEEEVLRVVMEQSKKDGGVASSEGTRKGKRGRDDNEDIGKELKRQRTVSDLSNNGDTGSQPAESDDDSKESRQKPRGAAARSQRDKELRDKAQLDVVNKRKVRGDRRRGEDSEPPDLLVRPSTAPSDADAQGSQPPDTPQLGPTNLKSHKKGTKAPSKRGKNQWTRDSTQTPLEADSTAANGERRSKRGAGEEVNNVPSGENTDGGGSGKEPGEVEESTQAGPVPHKGHGRAKGPKQINPHKISMAEIKRRTNAMMQMVNAAEADWEAKLPLRNVMQAAVNGAAIVEPLSEAEKENQQKAFLGVNVDMPLEEYEKLDHTEMAKIMNAKFALFKKEFGMPGDNFKEDLETPSPASTHGEGSSDTKNRLRTPATVTDAETAVNEEYRVPCEFCPKRVRSQGNLARHMTVHKDEIRKGKMRKDEVLEEE